MQKKQKIFISFFSLLALFILMSSTIFADYTFLGKRNSGAKFYVWYDSSVFNNSYDGYFNTGKNNWNNISSKVGPLTYNQNSEVNGKKSDRYYVGNTTNSGVLGYFNPMLHNGTSVNPFESSWEYGSIYAYKNQIDLYGLTSAQITSSVATHEVGHSLSLSHNFGSACNNNCVMTANALTSIAPNTEDKTQLKNKWGN